MIRNSRALLHEQLIGLAGRRKRACLTRMLSRAIPMTQRALSRSGVRRGWLSLLGIRMRGQPMELPAYGLEFLRDVFRPGIREALLCLARKNAKSAIVAIWLLACLCGPLRRRGWRAGVCSISKLKAAELKVQCEQIAIASNLRGLKFRRAPAPGRIESEFGAVDVLAADSNAGASAGFDLAICDELGLLKERDRDLIASLRSSVSARDGKFVALSVFGSAPFIPEILERRGAPGLAIHLYQAPEKAALDDEAGWAAANPGLTLGIKSERYMRSEATRVKVSIADQSSFRALDLNLPATPSTEMLVSLDDFRGCETEELPARDGPCFVGVDLGSSASMSAAVAYWPKTFRLESWAAFPSMPSLAERGSADGVGNLYERAVELGELMTFPGRVTPAGDFFAGVLDALQGADVQSIGADRFRRAESIGAFESANVPWRRVWRGVGASATADGSYDVRSFQSAIIERRIKLCPSVLFPSAIGSCTLRRDAAGNPAIHKSKAIARIDLVSAGVIATGLAQLHGSRPSREVVFTFVGASG